MTKQSNVTRTTSRIILGAFGALALAGLVTTASAKTETAPQSEVTKSNVQPKAKLPREWRWQIKTVNLDGMIRNR